MRIVVLAGGLSPERNVSVSSGTLIARALRRLGHRAVLVDPFLGFAEPVSEALFAREALFEAAEKVDRREPDLAALRASRPGRSEIGPGVLELCGLADLVFMGLHGQCGEDGRIQAVFDLLGIPYTGSGFLGSAAAMDKEMTKRIAASLGVLTPPGQTVRLTADTLQQTVCEAVLPCVVKPVDNGSSIGVSIAHTTDELRAALQSAAGESGGGRVLIERYIRGREIQIAVLGDRALPSIEITPKVGFYDYENKYQPGGALEVTPAPVDPAVERALGQAALTVHRGLGLAVYSRSDFILAPDGSLYFLEINTLPGMTPTSLVPQEAAAVDIGYDELCAEIVRLSLDERGR